MTHREVVTFVEKFFDAGDIVGNVLLMKRIANKVTQISELESNQRRRKAYKVMAAGLQKTLEDTFVALGKRTA